MTAFGDIRPDSVLPLNDWKGMHTCLLTSGAHQPSDVRYLLSGAGIQCQSFEDWRVDFAGITSRLTLALRDPPKLLSSRWANNCR